MDEDASLDDFLGGGTAAEESTGEADDDAAADDAVDEATEDAVTPATTTYAWDGDGAVCGACGERVDRRWQRDGELVCVACKSW